VDVYIRIYMAAMTRGLLRELGAERWETLCVLAFHMKDNGRCFPPQDKIARILGIGRQAANRRIKSLLAFEFRGQPIVELITDEDTDRRNNTYRILPISQMAIFGGEVEPLNMSPKHNTIKSPQRDISKKNMSRQHDTNNKKTNNKDNNIKTSDELSNPLPVEEFKNASAFG